VILYLSIVTAIMIISIYMPYLVNMFKAATIGGM